MQLQTIRLDEAETNYTQAIELFKMRCRSLNLSQNTINWYDFIFGKFLKFLTTQGQINPSETTPQHIRAFLDYHRQKGNAPACIRKFYDALKTFFGFLFREGIIEKSPIASLEKPKWEMKLIKPLNSEEIRLLLAQSEKKTFKGLRDYTILVTFLDTGLRLFELVNLKTSQINWSQNCLIVLGKGGKERVVPFGVNAKKTLWEYYQRRGTIEGQDTFFVDQFGQPVKMNWVQRIIRRYGRQAGIKGMCVSPHKLRHTFATQYILNGGDAFSLQQILGHSTLDMVKIYVGLANRDVALQHQKYSPIDRLGVLPNQRKQVVLK